jgi:glycosyltransferase involved in cell wall biosynthesis
VRILHISTEDTSGGAARAASRLHTGLLRLGHDSKMLVAQRTSDDPTVARINRAATPYRSLVRAMDRYQISRSLKPYVKSRPAGLDRFSVDRSEYAVDLIDGIPEADVVNLHWVADFVDYQKFFKCHGKRFPLVWTLHDMNVFTGGCHYDEGCEKFAASCGACPQLGSTGEHDLSRKVWSRKQKAFEHVAAGNLHIVADSEWLAGEATRSSLLRGLPITAIHYGLDAETFAPRNKLHARGALGIPADASVIMFAAELMTIRRKGLGTLVEAMHELAAQRNLMLLSVGRRMPELPAAVPHFHFGHVSSDFFLSILYSAADLFVIPSVQEAFGQTALEAMACGTPVVGSAVGGIPEIVQNGVTGFLVPASSPGALRDAILKLLEYVDQRSVMSANCRRLVLENHTLEVQARRYENLYHEIGADKARTMSIS